MAASILVAYATRGGSTGEVAQAIVIPLRESGFDVEVIRMREARAIGYHAAVVLGAPLYMGSFPGELDRFLRRNRTALSSLRAWFFVLGPIQQMQAEFDAARQQAERQMHRHAWLKPEELKVLGGRFDVNRMGFPFSLARWLPAFPLRKVPAMDIRDWDGIRAWAREIALKLKSAA